MKTFLGAALMLALSAAGVSGCGSSSKSDDRGSVHQFAAHGVMEVAQALNLGGGSCAGTGGYDDIRTGAQVVVRDAAGKSVALGALGPSKFTSDPTSEDPAMDGTCEFQLDVDGIPSGSSIYSIEVSHRGQVSFKEASAGSLKLSLG